MFVKDFVRFRPHNSALLHPLILKVRFVDASHNLHTHTRTRNVSFSLDRNWFVFGSLVTPCCKSFSPYSSPSLALSLSFSLFWSAVLFFCVWRRWLCFLLLFPVSLSIVWNNFFIRFVDPSGVSSPFSSCCFPVFSLPYFQIIRSTFSPFFLVFHVFLISSVCHPFILTLDFLFLSACGSKRVVRLFSESKKGKHSFHHRIFFSSLICLSCPKRLFPCVSLRLHFHFIASRPPCWVGPNGSIQMVSLIHSFCDLFIFHSSLPPSLSSIQIFSRSCLFSFLNHVFSLFFRPPSSGTVHTNHRPILSVCWQQKQHLPDEFGLRKEEVSLPLIHFQ